VGIAVILFPVLKGNSEPMALAYVCERVVELTRRSCSPTCS